MARAVSASRQFSSSRTVDRDDQPDERHRWRHDCHLQEAGRRLDVAGESRQDAARLHVPQLGQRQVEQPVEERPPERQHHPHVQQTLAVILEDPGQIREDDHADKRGAGQMEAREPRRPVERRVQEHAVDDEPHEERLDHLEPGADQREDEDGADRVAMRPQPAQVVAQVLAPFAALGAPGFRARPSPASPGSSSWRRLYFWTNSR